MAALKRGWSSPAQGERGTGEGEELEKGGRGGELGKEGGGEGKGSQWANNWAEAKQHLQQL